MSVDDEHNYVSAVFFNLLQPIADLCDRMLARGSGQPNEVQTAPAEMGMQSPSLLSQRLFWKARVVELVIFQAKNSVRQSIRCAISVTATWLAESRRYLWCAMQ
jgi:hypothetical protein